MSNMNTIINYKKLNRLTHTQRLPNGTMKYTFIPEKEYQLPNLNPPVPIIHYEGSKHKYLKHLRVWITYSIRMRQYLTLPGRGHIPWDLYPNQPIGLEQGDELMNNQRLEDIYKQLFKNY